MSKFIKLYDQFGTHDNPTVYKLNEIHHHVINRFGLSGSFSFVTFDDQKTMIIGNKISIWDNYGVATMLVKLNGTLLKFVDEKIIDEQLCFNAVEQTGTALIYVPEQFCNERICAEVIRKYNWIVKQDQ